MNTENRTENLTRNSIMNLLSDDEIVRVSAAETARLSEGEEYLDRDHLDRGVRRATGVVTATAKVLAKNTIAEATWNKILTQLVTPLTRS
jgi:hypothetical protein